MNPDNDWYGHKTVLADYCGLTSARSIYGYVPHGWYFDVPDGAGHRRYSSAPYFAWNKRHLDQLCSWGIPNVRCVGAPFIYLFARMYENRVPSGKGTILFPTHSAEEKRAENRHQDLIRTVEEAFPPPYTVSIFYQDLGDQDIHEYRERGWRVVSFGPRSNPQFLHQQITELASHSHVVANTPQTALWYGALLSRGIAIIGESSSHSSMDQDHDEETFGDLVESPFWKVRLEYPRLFNGGYLGVDAFEIGAVELGYEFKLNPDDLKESLGWSSKSKSLLASCFGLLVDLRTGKRARRGDLVR